MASPRHKGLARTLERLPTLLAPLALLVLLPGLAWNAVPHETAQPVSDLESATGKAALTLAQVSAYGQGSSIRVDSTSPASVRTSSGLAASTMAVTSTQVCSLTKYAGTPVLSVGTGGSWDDDDVWGPAVLKEGTTYWMWYTGDDGSSPARIGLATSTNGITWTKDIANNPVLTPTLGTWEANGIRAGSVISDSGVFKMWYTGYDSSWVGRIGYATSTDGISWTKSISNPVLTVGASGTWEDAYIRGPAVIKVGSTYHVWYAGFDGVTSRIGHATSSDGISWAKDAANPVLDVGLPGGWDWLHAYAPSVVAYGTEYLLWYSGETLPLASQTGYAVSSDGSTWARGRMLIPEGPPGAFDAESADYASAVLEGDALKVWYSGLSDAGTYSIGYATGQVCEANRVFLPLVMRGGQPTCPAYYSDDFSDAGSGWPVDDDANRRYAYTSGQYQIWVKQWGQYWAVTPGAMATDFTAAVSARRTSGSYGAYGIWFGISEQWDELYEVLVEANYYEIWKYSGGWTYLGGGTSGYINTGTGWNRLKVIRDGSSIAFYVNDRLLHTVSDGSLTGLRRIGLVAYSPTNDDLDARFDNFALYPADCGVSAAGVNFAMGRPGIRGGPVPSALDRSP